MLSYAVGLYIYEEFRCKSL